MTIEKFNIKANTIWKLNWQWSVIIRARKNIQTAVCIPVIIENRTHVDINFLKVVKLLKYVAYLLEKPISVGDFSLGKKE